MPSTTSATLRTVAPLTWSNNAGAGGIYSSVHDMARWMNVQLAHGTLENGTRAVQRQEPAGACGR